MGVSQPKWCAVLVGHVDLVYTQKLCHCFISLLWVNLSLDYIRTTDRKDRKKRRKDQRCRDWHKKCRSWKLTLVLPVSPAFAWYLCLFISLSLQWCLCNPSPHCPACCFVNKAREGETSCPFFVLLLSFLSVEKLGVPWLGSGLSSALKCFVW